MNPSNPNSPNKDSIAMTVKTPPVKTILLTGATSGIGKDAALDLAKRGYRVFATGRNQAALDELCDAGAGDLTAFRLDVTDADSIETAKRAVDVATDGYGLDVLINNAGYGDLGPTELVSDADMRRQFDTNVFGLMAVTRAFLPAMRERGDGRVINVSSIGGRVTMPMFGVYSASKYAVEALSDSLRMEMAPFGVKVVIIEPGPINTNFTPSAMENADKYREAGPYAAVIERAEKMAAFAEKSGVGPHVITRAIRKAMTSRWPKARYVAPFRGLIAVVMVKLMPTRVTDFFMKRMAGFTKKRLRAAARPAQISATSKA